MARRNIFDRDTRAGDYSDTLGNFLENIPSIYGQLAKEKRLEKQYQDEKNFRTTQYNNQLLQQARNNKINADKTTRAEEWQDFQKKDKEFNNRLKMAELASINNPGAVDSFLLSEGVITQEDFNSRKSINNDYNDLITDVDGYINMTVNDQFDNYHDATDMYNRLNQKLTVLKPNSPVAKTLRDEKNKLNKSLNFIKTKSGQVRPKSEWSSAADAVLYNQLTLDLNDYNKQLREIDAQITKAEASKLGDNTLLPLYAARDALQVETKDSFGKKGYEGSIPKTITELAMMGSKYKYPSIPDKPIPGDPTQSSGLADATDDDRDKIIEERNKFINSVEPLLRDDEAGLDALLDYYRDEGDESFSRVESTADILKKQLDAKAPKILGIVPDVSNEDFAGNEGDFRIIDNQPQVADPVVAEGGVIKPESEVVKTEPVVAEAEPAVEVLPPADEVPEPDQGGGNILSEILPIVSAAGKKPPIEEVKPSVSGKELFSTEPEEEIYKDKINKKIIKTQEEFYKKNDKNFDAGLNAAKNIFDSGIRDASGNKINIAKPEDFFNQIKSMANRIKQINPINESPYVYREGKPIPSSFVARKQLMFEQKQLYKDLFELKDKLKNVKNIYFPEVDSQGNKTGKLTKRNTSSYNQTLDRVISKLPKDYDLRFKKDPVSQSRYEKVLGY